MRISESLVATNYEVVKRYGYTTLVKCKLETGRTHQIRVHMKYIGHTLLWRLQLWRETRYFPVLFTENIKHL